MKTPLPKALLAAIALAIQCGCVSEPPVTLPPMPPPPPPDTNVYFYPANGRSVAPEQQDRDRFECNSWAVQQTGFDPSQPHVPPHTRVRMVAGQPPPGAAVAGGALTGAVVGAAVSNPWHTGEGALLGAVAGAAVGGIADAQRSNEINQAQAQASADAIRSQAAALERQATQFRRALSACLEGRGYSVQ